MLDRNFSHVSNYTEYMQIVHKLITRLGEKQLILDIPAGQGLLAEQLRKNGHMVTCADIDMFYSDYIHANLDEPLPFANAEFDICVCMEGIEHTLNPTALIAELCRITKPGGHIILTLPNIQNIFSRWMFLSTGCFYQFYPWMNRHVKQNEVIDRGHIMPLSFLQLRYLFEHYGAELSFVTSDRWKKKWLILFILPFLFWGRIWSYWKTMQQDNTQKLDAKDVFDHLFSFPVLFGRSLILLFNRKI